MGRIVKRGPALLFALLKEYRDKHALSTEEMADRLETKRFTLQAYFFGRGIKQLEPSLIRAAARVLGIPPVQAFLIAGVIDPEDILDPYTADDRLNHVVETIRNDPAFMGFAPGPEWGELPRSTKVLIALLYEQAVGRQVLSEEIHGN